MALYRSALLSMQGDAACACVKSAGSARTSLAVRNRHMLFLPREGRSALQYEAAMRTGQSTVGGGQVHRVQRGLFFADAIGEDDADAVEVARDARMRGGIVERVEIVGAEALPGGAQDLHRLQHAAQARCVRSVAIEGVLQVGVQFAVLA